MCSTHYTITPKDIYRYAASVLQPHLQWPDHDPECTVSTLLQVMFHAAAQLCSIFAACSRLRDAPSDQAVRDALVALCPEAETLEQQLNASFAAQLPKAVRNRRWRLAIDLNLRPYYGQKPTGARRNSTAAKPKAARPTFMPTRPAISCTKVDVILSP